MLDAIKFVRGAVKDRDTIAPVLTHFHISKGRIQGTNGRIHLDIACPDLDFEAVVPAEKFLRAVDACDKEPKFRFTDGNKLVIECKPFKAFLPHLPLSDFPHSPPTAGKKHKAHPDLLTTLRVILPFLSTDASRPWAGTAAFHKETGYVFGANNAVIAAQIAKDYFHVYVQIPIFTVEELLRIGTPPEHYTVDDTSLTFFWGDRWLRSLLVRDEWPLKTVAGFLSQTGKKTPLPPNLQGSINRVLPFCADPKFPVIYFSKDGVATAPGESQAEITGFDIGECALRADNLEPMLKHSSHICATEKVVMFWGKDFRGFMAPMRMT